MRIGINLRPLRAGQMGGLEVYVRNLLHGLLQGKSQHKYFLFTTPWNDSTLKFSARNVRKILLESNNQAAHRNPPSTAAGEMHRWTEKLQLDLWFCPMVNLEPRNLSLPTVITIPDLQHEFYPQFFSSSELTSRALMYKPSCEEATAVIAISEFTRRCIIERYGIPPEKVFCAYLAAGDIYRNQVALPPLETVRSKYKLPPIYALYPANTWPHKNHLLLILALHRFRQKCDLPLHLVFTGAEEHTHSFLREVIQHFTLQNYVHHLGYVGDFELARLYQGAGFLIFPSLFEGFGIPMLEAMHMGCPVLASQETSLAEVGGGAMLTFDPRQPDSIAAAMMRILRDSSLRRELVAKGFARARQFSWVRTTEETLAVFEWARSQPRPSSRREALLYLGGIHEDGWASECIMFDIAQPLVIRELELVGEAHQANCPLRIEVTVDCKPVAKMQVRHAGPFQVIEPIHIDCQDGRRVRVELLSDRSFVPAKIGFSTDSRALSYQVQHIRLKTHDGKQLVAYDRQTRV